MSENMRDNANENRNWYVVHTYSGYENKVKTDLEKRVESMEMEDKIFQIIVPIEEVVEYKDGKKKVSQRKVFPGYVMVEMIVTDDSWYVVRNTPGVTGFVSSGVKPIPLEKHEVDVILRDMGMAKTKADFSVGESVKVVSGPFENFTGTITEINLDKGKIWVSISMFGRDTPVELDFHQISKL
jgi:transcriptional antiterminator NusG